MQFFKNIYANQWFKITSLNSINVVLKIGSGLITSKIMAIFIGPTGIVVVGNARNFLTSLESIGTLGFQKGIIKYIAENKTNKEKINSILSTLFFSALFICVVVGIGLVACSNYLAQQLLLDISYFKYCAFLFPFYIASILLSSVLNGLEKYSWVINLSILGSVLSLLISGLGIYFLQTTGALLSLIVVPSLLSVVTWFLVFKEISFLNSINWSFFDFKLLQSLSHYSVMALVSGVLGPLVYIAIRKFIAQHAISDAGNWEALNRISNYYLLFVNTLLMVYYYPKLVLANNVSETKKVFISFYKQMLPLFIFGMLVFYVLKKWIILLFLSNEFSNVENLVFWQAIGDVFKVASWILGLQFFAKRLTKAFIITELTSLLVLYFSSQYLIAINGVVGGVQAHAITYFLYLLVLGVYFRKSLLG